MLPSKYGYFSEKGDEYIITSPDTPRPWINVLTNTRYGCVLSQAGGGFSWIDSSKLNMLTRWNQELVGDQDGMHLFLHDKKKKKLWSLGWNPCSDAGGEFSCTHGIGYSILTRKIDDIKATTTVFVPPDDTLEIRIVEIRNESTHTREICLQSALTWLCDQWYDAHREFHRTFLETQWKPECNAVYATKRRWDVPYIEGQQDHFTWPYTAFHAVSLKPKFASGDLYEIRGRNGHAAKPAALFAPDGIGSFGQHVDSAASLRVQFTLKPGQSKTCVFLLGAETSPGKAAQLIKKYNSVSAAKKAFIETRQWWKSLLSAFSCTLPDAKMNALVNYWLPYQAIAGRLFAKTGYYQNSGAYGYRDQLQDSLAWCILRPQHARAHILRACGVQKSDGSVCHWWFPNTPINSQTNCSDDFLWLPFILCKYIQETGDTSILKERVPFMDDGDATVLEHAIASVDRALKRLSPRGLPLIGDNDWNDGMSSVGDKMKGESVWLGHFLYTILNDVSSLLAANKVLPGKVKKYKVIAKQLKIDVNTHGWDGKWYLRATTDEGKMLGSKKCKEGRIFLNAQTWAVISGIADESRAENAMQKAREILFRKQGALLFAPPYTKPDPAIGYLTQYAPCMRENGGVYTHAAVWAILAEALLGNAQLAHDVFKSLCPIKPKTETDLYAAEPYVLPGNIDGPDTPTPGRAGWTWYTGSAAWMYHTIIRQLIGIQPTSAGLIIDPCIPKKWKEFSVDCTVQDIHVSLHIQNLNGVEKGIQKIRVNGKKVNLPISLKGKNSLDIQITMG